jgi:hypothetical protein
MKKVVADPESFVHRVRKKYDVTNRKDRVEDTLREARERLKEEPDRPWGNPPGIYWMRHDQEERVKEIRRREKAREEEAS